METKKKRYRRYYLHRKVKEFTEVNAYQKQIEVSNGLMESLTEKEEMYLKELNEYGYNLQTRIS